MVTKKIKLIKLRNKKGKKNFKIISYTYTLNNIYNHYYFSNKIL
jgi:hypothetical protein